MKKILILAICLSPVLATFLSCKKESMKSPLSEKTDNVKSKEYLFRNNNNWADAANSSNPYDDAGLAHNLGVRYILDTLVVDSLDAPQIYPQTQLFLNDQYGPSSDVALGYGSAITFTAFDDYMTASSDVIAAIDGSSLSSDVKTNLTNLFVDIMDTTYTSDYDSIKARIVTWESAIISSPLSSDDKEVLLVASSVLRYSILGWFESEQPLSTSGHILYRKGWLKDLFKAATCAVADAFVSACATFASAPLLGPFAPLAGAAAGAGVSAGVSKNW